jgi:hypothetical protein
MSQHTAPNEYIKRAKEAEDLAARTADPVARASWLEIAHGYRTLAEVTPHLAKKAG